MKTFFKPKVYLSARISTDAHENNNRVASYLARYFDVFKPHEHQVCTGRHEDIGAGVYHMDMTAMMNADFTLLVPPYGRDCSFEIGWFKGQQKLIYVFAGEHVEWLRDAMIKGAVTRVFASNPNIIQRLSQDPILKYKYTPLEKPDDLGEELLKFYNWDNNRTVIIEDGE